MLCDSLSGEFGITGFDGFASALLVAADIDSTSGDKVLEAAGCLGTNLDFGIIRPAKPVKRYEHLTGFAYWILSYSTSASVGMDCWAPTFVVAMALAFVASATESASDRPRAYPATIAPI